MNIIVFSYNRALQLHAFLNSFYRHFNAPQFEVNVIYNSGGGKYEEAYQQLIDEYPQAKFTRRHKIERISAKYFFTYKKNAYRYFKHKNLRNHLTNFKELVENIVAGSPYDAVAFFTDDSIFYRDISVDGGIIKEVENDTRFGTVYSLRHGLNIHPQPLSLHHYDRSNYAWNVLSSPAELAHWTHIFSIDGHVYPRRLLMPILKKLNYVNPNSFEGFVNDYMVKECGNVCNKLVFPEQSVLIGFELNKVQTFASNNNLNFSVEYLNDKFLQGFRLQYLYDESNVNDFRPHLDGIEFVHAGTGVSESISFEKNYELSLF